MVVTDRMRSAPLASAVIMLVVARRMSSTTQVVPDKSVWASASKSAGVKVVCNLTVAGLYGRQAAQSDSYSYIKEGYRLPLA